MSNAALAFDLEPTADCGPATAGPARIHLDLRHLKRDANWMTFSPDPVTGLQNVTPAFIAECHGAFGQLRREASATDAPYVVMQSAHPTYFSLGGDLAFFRDCIRRQDWNRLRSYSMRCFALLHAASTQLKDTHTTIALVQGRALGGGFELALSADHLVAEAHSTFAFPEILFGLFPCTGAMSLLAPRVGARRAEKMMTERRIYTAAELLEMGVVDEVCATGEGETAVERYVEVHASRVKARMRVQQSRERHAPLDVEENIRIIDDWVDTARRLDAAELRAMDMLIMMQAREAAAPAAREAA